MASRRDQFSPPNKKQDPVPKKSDQLEAMNEELRALNDELQDMNQKLLNSNEKLVAKENDLLVLNQELEWSKERFETILKDSTIFIAYQDQDLKYVWLFNQSRDYADRQALLGKNDEQILGDSPGTSKIIAYKKKVLSDGKEIHDDIYYNDRWWSVTIAPWFNAEGKIKGIKTLSYDVTNQRKVSERLELKKSIIDTYIHSNDDYVVMVNREGMIQVISQKFQDELETTWHIPVAATSNLDELNANGDPGLEYMRSLLKSALQGKRRKFPASKDFSRKLFKKDGIFSVETFPLIGRDDKIVGGALVGREITSVFETHEQIKEVVKRGANLVEEEYFKDLTQQLYELFDCTYGYIGLLSPNRKKIETLAIRKKGKLISNFSYALPDTPCESVRKTEAIQHYNEVSRYFPKDPKLIDWEAQAYVGVPINSPFNGKLMGILVMIMTRPVEMTPDLQYLLTILSLRAGAELERGKTTRQLRSRDEQLKRITRNSPDLIFEFERWPDGRRMFTYVSEVSMEILEVEPYLLLEDPENFYKLIYAEDLPGYRDIQASSTINPEWVQWTGRITTAKTGRNKWVKMSSRPTRGNSGEVIWNGTITDITGEITVQEELRIAKYIAEEATSAKQDFLATMSHEIRTPLNAIYGITELLMQDEQTKGHEYLDILKFSTDNLRSLINNILDFSKLKSGKYRLLQQKIKMPLLLGHLEKAHRYMASKHGNQFRLEIDKDVPEQVIGDEIVLAQILNNLLGNAVKFTENGEIILKVECSSKKGNLVQLTFSVSDTGIGIPDKEIEKIFGKFEQTDTGYRKKGGTGLGLTITRMLLELCQSAIKVESQEGKGTRFYFSLWFEMAKMLSDEEHLFDGLEPESRFHQDIRLLVVEDVDENRMLLIKYLSRFPHIKTTEAINGQQAFEQVRDNEFDLVLMDIRMPVMGGEESMKRIRGLDGEYFKNLPIIALTADTYGVEKSSGFTDVITKPFKFKNLLQVIEKYSE